MGPVFLRRCLSWHCYCLLAGACALLLPAVSRAADPVDELRDALKILTAYKKPPELQMKAKRKEVEDTIPKLKTISQLRRAYLLVEWSLDLELSKKETELGRLRRKIADRLTEEIETAAKDIDKQEKEDKQLAIAILIAEVADSEELKDYEKKEKFARRLTDVAIKLAEPNNNVAVRQVALHALGKITPDPKLAFPILERALKKEDVEVGPRRLAAYALTELVRNATHLEQQEMLDTIRAAIRTAAGDSGGKYALGDADERVRGYCLQAIQESARVIADQITEEYVLLDKTKKPEDKKAVEADITLNPELQVTLGFLRAINPQLLQALKHDEKQKVRLCALQALEKIAFVRSKIIPILGETDAKKDGETLAQIFLKKDDPLAGIVNDLKKPEDPEDFKSRSYLQSLLEEKDVSFRRGAIEFLELLGEQAAPALNEVTLALRDEDRFVRMSASRTIRNLRPKKVSDEAVLALAYNLLIDADADLSAAAADAIEALGPAAKQAVDALGIVIANPGPDNRGGDSEGGYAGNRSWDAESRVKAMKALVSIGPAAHSAIPKILTAMSDRDVRVRRQAAETLGLMGRPADPKLTQKEIDTLTQKVLDTLRKALRDEDAGVRLSASEAILTITATK